MIGEPVAGAPSAVDSPRRPLWLGTFIFLMAVAVSAVLSAAIVLRLPHQLNLSTDIVGYPIFAAYNADRLSSIYYIGVLFFPITALFLYLGLGWIAGLVRKDQPGGSDQALAGREAPVDWPASGWLVRVAAFARMLPVGVACGLGVTIAVGASPGEFWVVLGAVAAAYAVVVIAASLLLKVSAARVNVLASPLAIISLAAAAASTRVTIASDGSVHHYAWLPWWLAIAIAAAMLGWMLFSLSPSGERVGERGEEEKRLERRVLLFFVAPLIVFLLATRLPGDAPPMDMFHDGEGVAAARLTTLGYFPWRDLMSIHGFFQDSLAPMFGMQLLESSRWGADAGRALLLDPLSYVFLLVFIAWLFKRSWVLLLSFMALVVGARLLPIIGSRFMFLPLVYLLLAATLERRRWWLGVALGCVLAVQAIVVPETAIAIGACGLIVILHDFFTRRPAARLIDVFSVTAWCVAGGGAVILVFALVLLSQHALGDYVFYFSLFAANRGLAGGIPPDLPTLDLRSLNLQYLEALSTHRTTVFFIFSTPAALLLAFLYFASKVIRRRSLDTADWVIGAVAIFCLIYYTKFLERADLGHAQQVYQDAVPLIAFLVYRAVTYMDGVLRKSRWRPRSVNLFAWQPAAVASLLVAVMMVPGSLTARLAATPDRTHAVAANPPVLAQMGYSSPGLDRATYTDVGMVLKAYLRPGDWVFDFSNEPGLYYYLLGQDPRTRYYHVSMAIPEAGQQDLIRQLEQDQPRLVVFTNSRYGLPLWDGIPNEVRHYDVSQYVLDHYTPLLSSHTQIFYGLASANLNPSTALLLPLSEPALTDGLAFRGFACDWGYAPNFLSISPRDPARAAAPVTLATAPSQAGMANVMGWAVDMEAGLPASRVVVVADGQVVGEGRPTIDRPDVAQFVGKPGAVRSGFAITASIPARVLQLSAGEPFVQVFGVSASGVASELGIGPVARNGKPLQASGLLSALHLQDGRTVNVQAGPSVGIVDWIEASRYQLEVSPPPGAAWTDYRWMEIDTRAGFREDRWSLSDLAGGDAGHEIAFGTLDRSPSHLRVHVGSCAQWHGYAQAPLVLSYSNMQDITAVRLVP